MAPQCEQVGLVPGFAFGLIQMHGDPDNRKVVAVDVALNVVTVDVDRPAVERVLLIQSASKQHDLAVVCHVAAPSLPAGLTVSLTLTQDGGVRQTSVWLVRGSRPPGLVK